MCKICGNVPCTCYEAFCDPCREIECTNERLECVIYNRDKQNVNHLSCLHLANNISLEYFFEKLDERVCQVLNKQTPLVPVDTFSIDLTVSGIANHTLKADVIISNDEDNGLELHPDGLYIPEEDGRIKVDETDTLDYLVDQVEGSGDGVINIATYEDTGLLKVQPSIDFSALINKIKTDFLEKFCTMVDSCGPPPSFDIQASGLQHIINGAFNLTSTLDFTVDWGDGTVDNFIAGAQTPTHTYSTPFTGTIKVSSADLGSFTSFGMGGSLTDIIPYTGALSILTSEIAKLTGLVFLGMGESIFVDGVVSDLPDTLTTITIANTNLSGQISELPRITTYINIEGANTLDGPVTDLPPNLSFLVLFGLNTLSGDVLGIPRSVTTMYVEGSNTLSGNVADLPPNLTQVEVKGANTLTGDVNGFPKSIFFTLNIVGNNTIFGDITNLPPNLEGLSLEGNNTVHGDIATLPSVMTFIQITGQNNVHGNLAQLPAGAYLVNIIGNGVVIDSYTAGRVWASTMTYINIIPDGGGLSTSEIDNILIDLAASVTTWVNYKQVSLIGNSQARSSASDAAVATLVSRGVTVQTVP